MLGLELGAAGAQLVRVVVTVTESVLTTAHTRARAYARARVYDSKHASTHALPHARTHSGRVVVTVTVLRFSLCSARRIQPTFYGLLPFIGL